MKQVNRLRITGVVGVLMIVGLSAFAFAQNQTTTSQSQSGTGRASASASASSSGNGSQSALAGQTGGAGAGAGASAVGSPLKGMTYLVRWVPNMGTNGSGNAVALHQEYVKTLGTKNGVLIEGVLGGMDGRLAIVQGSAQAVNEFAMGSPLVQARLATVEMTTYNIEFSRVGLISDKKEDPAKVTDGSKSSGGGTTSSQNSTGSSQGSGGGR
ncbi:MAG: hypothetical protein ACKVQS_02145 [Fimbriimonadaceae bacterium]